MKRETADALIVVIDEKLRLMQEQTVHAPELLQDPTWLARYAGISEMAQFVAQCIEALVEEGE